MGVIWGLIAVLLVIVVLISIADVVRRHLSAGQTAAWILLVLILPFVGSLIYWALRRPSEAEVQRSLDSDRELRTGGTTPQHGGRIGP
ncbi:MAG TPA: PLD nuclease N-terminal domain-containing protein [Baekduia sp.]|nr:PLD nuclease N-terminal domain-containing protein [Baekduia sp.]